MRSREAGGPARQDTSLDLRVHGSVVAEPPAPGATGLILAGISVLTSRMGTLIHPRPFRLKQIDFVAALGDYQPDSH